MAKILKNNTAGDIFISDTGITVLASSQYTIPPFDYQLFAESNEIVTLVGNNTLTVNDGSKDLTPSQGINLIQGNFPTAAGGVGGYNLYDPQHAIVDLSTSKVTLPRSTESFTSVYNYSGSGALSGFTVQFNSDNVIARLDVDSRTIFELDCAVLEDLIAHGSDSNGGKFSWVDWNKNKNTIRFYPRHDLSFASEVKIMCKANSNSNKREMCAYLVDIVKES